MAEAKARARVLLVDDDEDDYLITRGFFEEMERGLFSLEWARSFEQAQRCIAEKRHELYLVDLQLGARSGLELLAQAKAAGARAPMIMLTGQGDRATDLLAMQAGADDFLEKAQLTSALLERAIRYAIERRRAEERFARADVERRHWHRLFLAAPALVNLQTGPDHVFELVHPLTRQLLGGRDVTGLPAREALPELAGQGYFELLDKVYQTGEPVQEREKPAVLCMPDGSTKEAWFDFTYQPWFSEHGVVAGVMTFAVDVSAQVRARRAIEQHVARLQEVEAELQDAVRARDEFLSIASHELKTPLTPLGLQIDSVRRALKRDRAIDPDEFVARLDIASRQMKRLHVLIDDLLDVARIAGGRLQLHCERTDLLRLARDVCDRFRAQADAAGCKLTLEADDGAVGRWDPLRLEQVLSNLLANAIKYGSGRPIQVSIRQGGPGLARLSVADGGIGIAREQLQRIFGRFERAVSTRNYGGLGLGLYIAHQIIEAHGGQIVVQSAPGAGSTFTVILPIDGCEALAEPRAPASH